MAPQTLADSQLLQCLHAVPDYRANRGKRYPLWVMLLLSILGVMSGATGYQALEDFGIRHYHQLCQLLGMSFKRMPSDSTLRRLFQGIDFEQLTSQFNQWSGQQFAPQPGDWLSVDGKSIKGTVEGGWDPFQNFVGLVSLYSHRHRLVIAQQGYENKHTSEIHVVQRLLEQLDLTEVVFTMDALHCQKNGQLAC